MFFVCDILIQVVRTQRKSNDSTPLKHVNLIQKVLKKVLDILYRKMYHCIKELVQQYSDTERSLYMAFKDYNKLSKLVDELDEQYIEITRLKGELKTIKSLDEYNELATKINVLVDEYNDKREKVKHEI